MLTVTVNQCEGASLDSTASTLRRVLNPATSNSPIPLADAIREDWDRHHADLCGTQNVEYQRRVLVRAIMQALGDESFRWSHNMSTRQQLNRFMENIGSVTRNELDGCAPGAPRSYVAQAVKTYWDVLTGTSSFKTQLISMATRGDTFAEHIKAAMIWVAETFDASDLVQGAAILGRNSGEQWPYVADMSWLEATPGAAPFRARKVAIIAPDAWSQRLAVAALAKAGHVPLCHEVYFSTFNVQVGPAAQAMIAGEVDSAELVAVYGIPNADMAKRVKSAYLKNKEVEFHELSTLIEPAIESPVETVAALVE